MNMLRKYLLITSLSILFVTTYSQIPGQPGPIVGFPGGTVPANLDLPKFDLDFQGGTPTLLIVHINEALRKQQQNVNVIIPTEYDSVGIPPMKLKSVNVQQVFEALTRTSQKRVTVATGVVDYGAAGIPTRRTSYSEQFSSYSFQAVPPISTNSIWYFVVTEPSKIEEVKTCQFYQLGPYLQQGLNVNDITTAIKAGYKMLGESAAPELNFHEETSLLIAVGPESKLKLIDQVLSQLSKAKPAGPEKSEKPEKPKS